MFKNLDRACIDLGPPGFKRICPEALEVVGQQLDTLPVAVRVEYREFMRLGRAMFAPVED